MKVLYFSRDYSPHDERFLTALAKTAHEILFLRFSPSREIKLPGGVSEVIFPGRLNQQPVNEMHYAEELKHILNELKPDVVHAGPLNGPAHIAALSGFSPLVSMSWGSDILHDGDVNQMDRKKIQHTLKRSTVLIGDCLAVVEKAANDYEYPRERIFRFPWGVDLAHFSPATASDLRRRLGWQDNFVFLSNRSFEEIYRVDVTLRAFIEAEKQAPEIRLLLYGKGSFEEEFRRMALAAGVMEKIHFGGFISRTDLPASYHAADIFLSASYIDGSSVSLLEALACGKPVLVSDIPGNLEWVHAGENGWVFPYGDSHALANFMLNASRTSKLAEMGNVSRHLAEERADWQKNFPILIRAYEKALELQGAAHGGEDD